MPEAHGAQRHTAGERGVPLVEIRGLTKRFGEREAVRHIDLNLYPGECLGLLGPNGAGKTTTLCMLLGLVTPSSGSIRVFGQPHAKRLRQIKRRIGVAPQADNLDPDLTVLQNLLTYASYFRIDRQTARKRSEELLDFFALGNRSGDVIQHLSGGQRRRLLISRALINAPDLLILDEPTIGLDPQARHLIWDGLENLRARGTTMLLTSHYMEEVSRLTSRVMIMDQGSVVAEGNPAEMVRNMVGSEVFEITDGRTALDSLQERLRSCNADEERAADRLFVYAKAPCPELEALAASHKHVTRRPANLEDLFLKLTGRTLREG